MGKTVVRRLLSAGLAFLLCLLPPAAVSASAQTTDRYGDVDGDGRLTAADALGALQHAVRLRLLTGDVFRRADVDGDGRLTAADALLILQFSVRLITAFPVVFQVGDLWLDTRRAYTVEAEIRTLLPHMGFTDFHTLQGGCWDGERFYMATVAGAGGKELTRIRVFDAEWDQCEVSEPLEIDHANTLTYNPRLDRLVAAHCQAPEGHYNRYSLIDPHTLRVTDTVDCPEVDSLSALAYCGERDQYVSTRWGGHILDVWDGDMRLTGSLPVTQPDSLLQGMCCDADCIYSVRSYQNDHPAELRIYDWEGRLLWAVTLPIVNEVEPEDIQIVNGEMLVFANGAGQGQINVYALRFVPAKAG